MVPPVTQHNTHQGGEGHEVEYKIDNGVPVHPGDSVIDGHFFGGGHW